MGFDERVALHPNVPVTCHDIPGDLQLALFVMPILYEYPLKPTSWTIRDVLLFANTIGSFPTFPINLTFKHDYLDVERFSRHFKRYLIPPPGVIDGFPQLDIEKAVDGERTLEVLRDVPVTSCGRDFHIRSRVVEVWDKGAGRPTIVKTEHDIIECVEAREKIFTKLSETTIFMGQGGWGGENDLTPPTAPSRVFTMPTASHDHHISHNAHLIYRLNGDYNPLHAVRVNEAIIQPTPIMHGLYSWNVVAHAILEEFKGGKLRKFRARFKAPVRPGDVLEINMWDCRDGEVRFDAKVKGRLVLQDGIAVLDGRSSSLSKPNQSGPKKLWTAAMGSFRSPIIVPSSSNISTELEYLASHIILISCSLHKRTTKSFRLRAMGRTEGQIDLPEALRTTITCAHSNAVASSFCDACTLRISNENDNGKVNMTFATNLQNLRFYYRDWSRTRLCRGQAVPGVRAWFSTYSTCRGTLVPDCPSSCSMIVLLTFYSLFMPSHFSCAVTVMNRVMRRIEVTTWMAVPAQSA
nr:peroxisomal hydratase-dehydrogenase-epimerase [Quercus suber]